MAKFVKSIGLFVFFQVIFIVLFGVFGEFSLSNDESIYPKFMDVQVMLVVGFGFLMTFLKRHGYGSIGFNFLVVAVVFEWAILMLGWIQMIKLKRGTFQIGIIDLLEVDYCTAAVLVSLGVVIGKATISQLLIMSIIEVLVQTFNKYICEKYLVIHDAGNSIYIFVFGAFFGLAVSKVINVGKFEDQKDGSSYNSNLFAMIGTLFLWLYWPSFNSASSFGKVRAIINTHISLVASCVTAFIFSALVGKGKLKMAHIQNATLAGGVAIGAVADVVSRPVGSVIIGSFSGIVSLFCLKALNPLLKKIKAHDSTGVFAVFGISGLISAIASGIIAAAANESMLSLNVLYQIYPGRNPSSLGRTSVEQGGFQILALVLTLGMSIAGGLVSGLLMKLPLLDKMEDSEDMFEDENYWYIDDDFFLNYQKYVLKEQYTIRI